MHRDLVEGIAQSERMQDTPSVWADLNSGAHFAERRGSFKDRDIVAAARDDQRRCKSADTSTNNSEPHESYSLLRPEIPQAMTNV
jgi:hypothetical protein